MGSVQVDVADPFRHSLIGLAPLVFGSITVLMIGQGWLGLERIGQALGTGDLATIWQAIKLTLTVPDVWIWLYLLFAISNAMLPSASDREAWRTALIYLVLALFFAVALGIVPEISLELQALTVTILTYLLTAFTITIAVDIFFIFIILCIEVASALILGRRVQYNR